MTWHNSLVQCCISRSVLTSTVFWLLQLCTTKKGRKKNNMNRYQSLWGCAGAVFLLLSFRIDWEQEERKTVNMGLGTSVWLKYHLHETKPEDELTYWVIEITQKRHCCKLLYSLQNHLKAIQPLYLFPGLLYFVDILKRDSRRKNINWT